MTDRIETVEDFLDLIARRAAENHYRREGVNIKQFVEEIAMMPYPEVERQARMYDKPMITGWHMAALAMLLGMTVAFAYAATAPATPCPTERC